MSWIILTRLRSAIALSVSATMFSMAWTLTLRAT